MPATPSIKKNPDSTIEIEGEIPVDEFEKHREAASRHLGKDVEIAGFRKGHAPAYIVAKRIGGGRVLEEMANRALAAHLPKLFREHNIDAIGKPQITVTKLAPKNPLGFKLTTAVLPDITLPDYQVIAKAANEKSSEPVTVTEKEIENAVLDIRKRVQATENQAQKTKKEKLEKGSGELPELDDELVKKLGNFASVSEFRNKLTEDIQSFKERQAREKRRIALIESIAQQAQVRLPELLVTAEVDKMLARFKDDVIRVGAKWEEYLQQIKKTEGDLRKEWHPDAEKNATIQLVLNEIAKKENLALDEKAVELEVLHLESHHPDADPRGLEVYVRTLLTNEKVFEFLENQK
ncbi:hypothetical protein L0Y40_00895 [Candidatus Wolfebacteria bacterium]|nr:hypothetical protein [Candidatus Wolfebacteria bacterium]